MEQKLSKYFDWIDVTKSQVASRFNIDNSLPPELKEKIIFVAREMDYIRVVLGRPIIVSSWFRCATLNLRVGGTSSSQHVVGEAVDWESPEFGTPAQICSLLIQEDLQIPFDQLILEHEWVHTSFQPDIRKKPRKQVLSLLSTGKYAVGLTDKNGVPLKIQ